MMTTLLMGATHSARRCQSLCLSVPQLLSGSPDMLMVQNLGGSLVPEAVCGDMAFGRST